jgi:outer membrane protein assembly factor BamE (lipoprotein component of BamABCDE complex)
MSRKRLIPFTVAIVVTSLVLVTVGISVRLYRGLRLLPLAIHENPKSVAYGSSADEVRAILGPPTGRDIGDDGTERWYYQRSQGILFAPAEYVMLFDSEKRLTSCIRYD